MTLPIDIGPLQVNRVIVHDVPTRIVGQQESGVIYSEIESQLSQQSKNYFRARTIRSLESAGLDVRFSSDTSSPVPELLRGYLVDQSGADFVDMSQQVAKHLYDSQTGVNSPGLLCVLEVRITSTVGVAILKLNREGAVRIRQIEMQGSATFDLDVVQDLVLSERIRVFKAGLFYPDATSLESVQVVGMVSDNQRGYAPASQVADFFLKRFLGCEMIESAEGVTKNFFDATEEWIAQVPNPERQAQYETALLSELNNERRVVTPVDFAETHLRQEDRQDFRDWLSERDVNDSPFEKDTHLIRSRLRRMRVDFESGISVSVPPDTIEQGYVKISTAANDLTRMEIEDRLREMRGR